MAETKAVKPTDSPSASRHSAGCGLRAGELWALRRRDVDLLRGTLHVERAVKEINTSAHQDKGLLLGPTKSHADRSMAIPGPLLAEMKRYLSEPSSAGPAAWS